MLKFFFTFYLICGGCPPLVLRWKPPQRGRRYGAKAPVPKTPGAPKTNILAGAKILYSFSSGWRPIGGGEEAPHTKVVRGGSPKGKTRAQILPVAPVAPNI